MIDEIYIKEAIRIRREYLENLTHVNIITEEYEKLLIDLQDIKDKIEILSEKNLESVNEKHVKGILDDLSIRTKQTYNNIKPYTDKNIVLDEEQSILYKKIKEKYPDLSDDELYKQLIPIIQRIDNEFDF